MLEVAGSGVEEVFSGAKPQKAAVVPDTFAANVPAPVAVFTVSSDRGELTPALSEPPSKTIAPS
jgi:hypothetical protein